MPLISSTSLALLCLIAGNLMASLSDVAVKLMQGGVPIFQYIFIRQLIAVLVIAPLYIRERGGRKQTGDWKITAIRAHLILIGAACMVVAITHLPLATANAVFYAAPLLMLPVSTWLLKEKPPSDKVLATIVGFVGVLIVLRPSQFHWAAIFALGTATTLALFNILVRKLPAENSVVHTLFWTSALSIPTSGVIALFDWQPLNTIQLFWVAASSLSILAYNALAVVAYRKAQAGQIALAEYSGLIFVTLFGIVWFDEVPDLLTLAGIILIILPLLPRKLPARGRRAHHSG